MVIPEDIQKHYPFSSSFFPLENENFLHYLDEGEGDPILCLHGNPTWSFFYRKIVSSFKDRYRVVVPDHLGCGLSAKVQDEIYDLENHISNVEKLVSFLDLKNITLIVHDWGGPIGLGFLLRNKLRVKKLVILNTAAFLSKDIPRRIALLKDSKCTDFLIRKWNLFCLPATFMTTVKPLSKELKAGYLYPYRSFSDRVAISAFVKDIPMQESDKSYELLKSIEEGLSSIELPKLILWGAKDFCFHMKFFKRWERIYPNAKKRVFSQAGHYLIEDEPEKVVEEIADFLVC